MSTVLANGSRSHQDAPTMLLEPRSVLPFLCSPLLPPEMSEIAASAVKPVNQKKLRRLAKKSGENQLPLLVAMENEVAKSFSPQLIEYLPRDSRSTANVLLPQAIKWTP